MISNRELVKAGKVPLRVIGSWNVDLATYGPVSPTSDLFATLARKCVYRARIQRYKPHLRPVRFYHSRFRRLAVLAHDPMVRLLTLFHSTRDFFTDSEC